MSSKELPCSTDIERMNRVYLGVFGEMAIQVRDGATAEELEGVAAAAMNAWPVTVDSRTSDWRS